MWIRDFIDCLEGSTRGRSRIDEALAIKQQHLPKRIYKYRRDCDHSRDNLKTDTVRLSSPDSYNDPYDCEFKLSDGPVITAFKRRFVDEFVRVYNLRDVVSVDQIEDAKNSQEPMEAIVSHIPEFNSNAPGSNPKGMAGFTSTVIPRLVRDALTTIRLWRKVTKLCSFSEINNSLLMWSHYAERHQGICLGFDVPDECSQVEYLPAVMVVDRLTKAPADENDVFSSAFCGRSTMAGFTDRKFA